MSRRVQVVIIGAGPSGLLLGQLLHLSGVEAVREPAIDLLAECQEGSDGTADDGE